MDLKDNPALLLLDIYERAAAYKDCELPTQFKLQLYSLAYYCEQEVESPPVK